MVEGNKKGTRVLKICKIENQDVYNMEVEGHHNFSVEGGLIVHNCMDRDRYFIATRFRLPITSINLPGNLNAESKWRI